MNPFILFSIFNSIQFSSNQFNLFSCSSDPKWVVTPRIQNMSIHKYARMVKTVKEEKKIHVIAYSNKVIYNVPCCGSARVLKVTNYKLI